MARALAAGACAAAAATVFSNPFDVVKTRMQLQGELGAKTGGAAYSSPISGLRQIFAEGGMRGVQAGLAPAIMFQVAMNGVRLGSFPYLSEGFQDMLGVRDADAEGGTASTEAAKLTARLGAGMTAGVLGACIAQPFYLVKSRLQSAATGSFRAVQSYDYKGPMDGLARIVRDDGGFAALFRGWDAAALRLGAGSAAQLTSYVMFKERVAEFGFSGLPLHAIASAGASMVVTACMTPFDVVSTRYMQSTKGSGRYSSPLDCFVKTARAEGARGLWKGAGALYLRLAPHTILTLTFLEQFRILFDA